MATTNALVSGRSPSHHPWLRWLRNYAAATFAYGAVRASTYEYEGTREYYNRRTRAFETKPMLGIDRLGRIMCHGFQAFGGWPLMLGGDLTRLECAARGLDRVEYGCDAVSPPTNKR